MTKRFVVLLGSIGVSAVLVVACSATDEEAGTPKKPSSTTTDATISSDAPSEGATSVQGLCARVKGPAVVAQISDDIFAKASSDCRIGAYFTAMPAAAQTHAKECMRRHLQEVFGCPNVTYSGFKSSAGRECRSLSDAHNDLTGPEGKGRLNKADFQAYRELTAAALKAGGLTDDDLAKVGAVILNYEGQVAPRVTTDYNTNCSCSGGVHPGSGKACIPDGGYVLPDATPLPDDAGNETGVADAGAPQDAADDG